MPEKFWSHASVACIFIYEIFIFQHNAWMSKDGSSVTYINWAKHYQFPTEYDILYKNKQVRKIFNARTQLSRHASQDDGMCSAGVMAPDFTGALLFPVDCSRNFNSQIVCTPHRLYNKSLDYKDHAFQLHYDGYKMRQHKNSSVLKMSTYICPEGYILVHSNRVVMGNRSKLTKVQSCLQLVRYHDVLSVKTIKECSRWSQGSDVKFACAKRHCWPNLNFSSLGDYSRYYLLECAEEQCSRWSLKHDLLHECSEWNNKSQKVINMFNMTCKQADMNSSVYGGVGDHWLQETDLLNKYLLQVLPTKTLTFMSWQEGATGDRTKCLGTVFCPHFPLHKRRFSHLDELKSSRPFVLCARNQIMSPIIEVPLNFEPFPCADGSFIAISLQCDGIPNCPDAEDEQNCTHVCTNVNINCYGKCVFPSCQCSDFYYQCIDGGCITFDKFCDRQQDCPLEEDEQGCVTAQKTVHSVSDIIQDVNLATGFCLGRQDSLPCVSQTECYNLHELCHYDTKDGTILYCADGTHLGGHCKMHVCNHQYKCDFSYCIPTRKVCNGIVDCPDADDEAHCDNMACPGHLRCSHTTFCVPPHEICDGEAQCPLEEDEKFCIRCPAGCVCHGSIVSCNNADVVNLQASPAVLILHNSSSAFYQLQKNMSHFLDGTFYLRLNHGNIQEILHGKFSVLRHYNSLRWLQLNNQGIQILNKNFIHGPLIKWLDLSSNIIQSVKHQAFKEMKSIAVLNLDSNKLKNLKDYFFESLGSLRFLYLQGNPLIEIDSQILMNSPRIHLVRSDRYMLCCAIYHVEDCKPKGYLVSSCERLLSFLTAKIFITIQAVFAILVNGGVLVRLFMGKYKAPDRPLMISLVAADIMMGMYLLVLTITDLSTSGAFHMYIAQWTQSYICLVAGILNFMSSEVSLCVLTTLSVVRAIALQKVGGLKVMKKKIIYASMCVWVFIFSLVILYILAFEHGIIRLRNNMCIILGTSSHHYVSVPEYVFQIMLISLNSIFLFILCTSAFTILAKVYLSLKSVSGIGSSHSQHSVSKIGARLMLLLFFNFVCWIPILCVASIMLTARNVHENVLIWMAIFILPISATTDPFLYNIHLLKKEKTQK